MVELKGKYGTPLDRREVIEDALNELQARTRERNLKYTDIVRFAEKLEDRYLHPYGGKISKKNFDGCGFFVNKFCTPYPNAYKYTPNGTEVYLYFHNSRWYVRWLDRADCNRSTRNQIKAFLSDTYIKAVKELMKEGEI